MRAYITVQQVRDNLRLNARRVLLAPRDHLLWFCYFQTTFTTFTTFTTRRPR